MKNDDTAAPRQKTAREFESDKLDVHIVALRMGRSTLDAIATAIGRDVSYVKKVIVRELGETVAAGITNELRGNGRKKLSSIAKAKREGHTHRVNSNDRMRAGQDSDHPGEYIRKMACSAPWSKAKR